MSDFFDKIRDNQKLVQLVLIGLTVPFLFFGLDSYTNLFDHAGEVAKVGDTAITRPQLDNAVKQELDIASQQSREPLPDGMANDPTFRQQVLNKLISFQASEEDAKKMYLTANQSQIVKSLQKTPGFSEKYILPTGEINIELLEKDLRDRGSSIVEFEDGQRRELIASQRGEAITLSGFMPKDSASSLITAVSQQRDIAAYLIKDDDVLGEIKVDDKAVETYYTKNIDRYKVPAMVDVNYIVLDEQSAKAGVQVSDAEVKQYYESNLSRYQEKSPRPVRHILVSVDAAKGIPDKAAAKKKAEEYLAIVKKDPSQFAAVAKKYSQDPGSAVNGGDLGVVSAGQMVKPFEDAVFSLKKNEISGLVESDYGYHIIEVMDAPAVKQTPLSAVSAEIRAQLLKEKGSNDLAKKAQSLIDAAKSQSKSIDSLAKEFNLPVLSAKNLSANGSKELDPKNPLNSPMVLSSVFSDEVAKGGKTTQALTPAPNMLVVAQVSRFNPEVKRSLAEVRDTATVDWKRTQAHTYIVKKATEWLSDPAKLSGVRFGEVTKVGRMDPTLDRKAADKIFMVPAKSLPAYTGVDLGSAGYAIYKVVAVNDTQPTDPQRKEQEMLALDGLYSRALLNASSSWAKDAVGVKIYQENVSSGLDTTSSTNQLP